MENEIEEKFLPIGSVVLLKGGFKKVMITGFCSADTGDKTKIYDYTGCVYPEGYLNFEQICLFDHEQIEKLLFTGYKNEEETAFKTRLNELLEKLENDDDIEGYLPKEFIKDDQEIEEESSEDTEETPQVKPEIEINNNGNFEYL